MKVDQMDKTIFQELKENGATTTELAKKIFSPDNLHELKRGDNFIRARMKKWEELGVLKGRETNGKTTYNLLKDKVFIGDASVVINEKNQDAVLPLGAAILIKTDNEWALFEGKKADSS